MHLDTKIKLQQRPALKNPTDLFSNYLTKVVDLAFFYVQNEESVIARLLEHSTELPFAQLCL
jgi:hypothetical protein